MERNPIFDAYLADVGATLKSIADAQKVHERNMQEFDSGMAELRKSQEETAISMKETDRRFKETERFLNSVGDKLAGIEYDEVLPNISSKLGNVEDEYDIIMLNGTSAAIIETKYRIHPNFLDKMISQKVSNFRTLYPEYAKHTIYLGIASFSFNNEAIRRAKKLGIGILKQVGDTIEYDTENMKAY